jgi:hypothetical protein
LGSTERLQRTPLRPQRTCVAMRARFPLRGVRRQSDSGNFAHDGRDSIVFAATVENRAFTLTPRQRNSGAALLPAGKSLDKLCSSLLRNNRLRFHRVERSSSPAKVAPPRSPAPFLGAVLRQLNRPTKRTILEFVVLSPWSPLHHPFQRT